MESQCFLLRITMIRWQLAQPTTPARTFASFFTVRAVQEECTLIREAPGYSDYAARVRCRLSPPILVNRLRPCHRLFPATPECRKCRSNDSTVQRFNVAKPARATERFAQSADRRAAGPK